MTKIFNKIVVALIAPIFVVACGTLKNKHKHNSSADQAKDCQPIDTTRKLSIVPAGNIEFYYSMSDSTHWFDAKIVNLNDNPIYVLGSTCNGAHVHFAQKNYPNTELLYGYAKQCFFSNPTIITMQPKEELPLEFVELIVRDSTQELGIQVVCVDRCIPDDMLFQKRQLLPEYNDRGFKADQIVWGKPLLKSN